MSYPSRRGPTGGRYQLAGSQSPLAVSALYSVLSNDNNGAEAMAGDYFTVERIRKWRDDGIARDSEKVLLAHIDELEAKLRRQRETDEKEPGGGPCGGLRTGGN